MTEDRTISSEMKKRLEAMEVWFYRRMLRIAWSEPVSHDEVLEMMQTRRKLILNIKKSQLKFLGHVRKEGLENPILTGWIVGKRDEENQCMTYLVGLSKWRAEHCLGKYQKNKPY